MHLTIGLKGEAIRDMFSSPHPYPDSTQCAVTCQEKKENIPRIPCFFGQIFHKTRYIKGLWAQPLARRQKIFFGFMFGMIPFGHISRNYCH